MKQSKTILTNFRMPPDLKQRFSDTCKSLNIQQTSVLNMMVRDFVQQQQHSKKETHQDYDLLGFFNE